MFQRGFFLLLLCIIGILSSLSVFSLLNYFDPYIHISLAITLLTVSFLGAFISCFTFILYIIKNIYYRGAVGVKNILTSVRQSFFMSLIVITYVASISLEIPYQIPVFASALFLLSCELFLQSIQR